MHRKKRLQLFLTLSAKQFNCKYYQTNQKYKKANAIDAMHVSYPFIFWPIWIFLFKVEIFCYLVPYSHVYNLKIKQNYYKEGLKN